MKRAKITLPDDVMDQLDALFKEHGGLRHSLLMQPFTDGYMAGAGRLAILTPDEGMQVKALLKSFSGEDV